MGFLNSVKSRFKSHDASEEEEFERAFREGRFPDDEGFEPLSSTGHFVAAGVQPEEPSLPDPDEGLERMGMGTGAFESAPQGQGAPQQAAPRTAVFPQQGDQPDPFAAPAYPHMAVVSSGVMPPVAPCQAAPAAQVQQRAPQGGQVPPQARPQTVPARTQAPALRGARAPQQGRPAPTGGFGVPAGMSAPVAPSASAALRPIEEEDVQVFERQPGRTARPATPQGPSFADRLQARVAAANVSGVIDDGLGRSRIAVGGPGETGSGKVVRPSGPARPRRGVDVQGDELEAELAERRRSRRGHGQAAPAPRPGSSEGARRSSTSQTPARSAAPAPAGRRSAAENEAPARSERPASQTPAARQEPAASRPAPNERPASSPVSAASDPIEPFKLPTTPIVLRPRLYDDVSQVAAGVISHHQPVVLVLRGSSAEVARRVMDFSFGLCCGTGAEMEQLDDRVYAVVPRGTIIGDPDMAALRRQGVLRG